MGKRIMNKNQIADIVTSVGMLEWLGIRMEDVKTENIGFGLIYKTAYYFSVPESSTIEINDIAEFGFKVPLVKELNSRIKTSNGLKLLAKEKIIDMTIDSCRTEFPDDEEFIADVKQNISEYFKFYGKVRKGEVWNKEMGEDRIKELTEAFQKINQLLQSEYSEVK